MNIYQTHCKMTGITETDMKLDNGFMFHSVSIATSPLTVGAKSLALNSDLARVSDPRVLAKPLGRKLEQNCRPGEPGEGPKPGPQKRSKQLDNGFITIE